MLLSSRKCYTLAVYDFPVSHGEVKDCTSYGSRTGEVINPTSGRSSSHVENG